MLSVPSIDSELDRLADILETSLDLDKFDHRLETSP